MISILLRLYRLGNHFPTDDSIMPDYVTFHKGNAQLNTVRVSLTRYDNQNVAWRDPTHPRPPAVWLGVPSLL